MFATMARILLIVVLAGVTVAGCAQRVAQRVDDARTAVEAARAAGAPVKAPQEFQAAEQALKESEALLAASNAQSISEAQVRAAVAEAMARSAQTAAGLRVDLDQARAEVQVARQEASRAAAAAASAQATSRTAVGAAEQAQAEARRASASAQRAEGQASEAVRKASAPPPAPAQPAITFARYVVKKGDTLPKIAARADAYGDSGAWQRLYEANREIISTNHKVRAGQVLLIPMP
jgi:nucleoid-associated protein YgaU